MDGKIDTVREALIKLRDFAKRLDCDYQEKCTPGEDDMCESCKHVYIAELALAALSAIDLEAHGCDELVEKVITFINNRVTIGETEDECGDLVSVLELDKDFRTDLAKMLFAIDPDAIRRALRSASKIVKETALEMGLDDEEVFSISGIIDPDIPGNYEAIISTEPAQDESKEADHEPEC